MPSRCTGVAPVEEPCAEPGDFCLHEARRHAATGVASLGHRLGHHTEAMGDEKRHRGGRSLPQPKGPLLRPTIVLVHGAFAESASWDGVIDPLVAEGHRVIAAANPLRGLASDAAAVSDVVRAVDGPVVLVGHSYGGAV